MTERERDMETEIERDTDRETERVERESTHNILKDQGGLCHIHQEGEGVEVEVEDHKNALEGSDLD